jgi:hypothetical protein
VSFRLFEFELTPTDARGFGPVLVIGPDNADEYAHVIGASLAEAIRLTRHEPPLAFVVDPLPSVDLPPSMTAPARPNRAQRRSGAGLGYLALHATTTTPRVARSTWRDSPRRDTPGLPSEVSPCRSLSSSPR